MKNIIVCILILIGFEVAAQACDSLEVRRDGDQIVCYRYEKKLSLDAVKERYARYKPDMVILNVPDAIGESEAQRVVDVIEKEGFKVVRVARPEKK